MIRTAEACDYPAIRAIIRHAFGHTFGHTFGQADEAELVERLRIDGEVLIELVAGEGVGLFGHVLYSRLALAGARGPVHAAALAPVSVLPAHQRQGVGGNLIRAGNDACRALGIEVVLVLGDPGYYQRFGFSTAAAESLECVYAGPNMMALELAAGSLAGGGRVHYPAAFGALE